VNVSRLWIDSRRVGGNLRNQLRRIADIAQSLLGLLFEAAAFSPVSTSLLAVMWAAVPRIMPASVGPLDPPRTARTGWQLVGNAPTSFAAQGCNRVDAAGPPRRDEACGKRCGRERQQRDSVRHRVGRGYPVKQRSHDSRK
jgi:hypothetical protein